MSQPGATALGRAEEGGAGTIAATACPNGGHEPEGNEVQAETSSQREASLVQRSASRLAGLDPNGPRQQTREELIEAGMSAAEADARLVRQHQNEVLQAHFMRWVLCSFVVWTMIMAVGLALQLWVIIEFASGKEQECSVPLRLWVKVLLALWSCRFCGTCIDRCICCFNPDPENPEPPPCRILCKNMVLALFDFIWVIVLGLHWIISDRAQGTLPACQSLTPDLYAAAKGYICFHLASVAYVWLNIIGLRQMLTIMMRRGLLRTSSAAPPGAFDKNTKEIKVSEVDLEANPSCPVCMEDYSDAVPICKTNACSHVFHKQCLKNWLKTARTCPICRHDLGEMGGGASPSPA